MTPGRARGDAGPPVGPRAGPRRCVGAARDATRRAQVGSGMRGDKRRTVRTQDDQVVDAVSGRSWRFKDYERGIW